MVGTPAEQAGVAHAVSGLADQDYYNYIKNALGLYGQGLAGEGGMYQTGMEASKGLGEDIADVGESQVKAQSGGLSGLLSGLGGAAGFMGKLFDKTDSSKTGASKTGASKTGPSAS